MIPAPITADELREAVPVNFYDESWNQDSPYSISLPLSDWKSIYERLKAIEECEPMIDKMLELTAEIDKRETEEFRKEEGNIPDFTDEDLDEEL